MYLWAGTLNLQMPKMVYIWITKQKNPDRDVYNESLDELVTPVNLYTSVYYV